MIKVCKPNGKGVCGVADCKICFDRSFAKHERAQYWSVQNVKKPSQYHMSSSERVKFDCANCKHTFEHAVRNIVIKNSWCPYCFTGKAHQLYCEDDACMNCFERSFASHEKAKYWSAKNPVTPRQTRPGSHSEYLFDCPCGHEIKQQIYEVTVGKSWCQYCNKNTRVLCDKPDCIRCHNKSMASCDNDLIWGPSNTLTPRQVFKHSNNHHYFTCNECDPVHEFRARPNDAYGRGTRCPNGSGSKTEKKMEKFLKDHKFTFHRQTRYDWCRSSTTNRKLPFDFSSDELKLIIEVDGDQHFQQVRQWLSPEMQHTRDVEKMQKANEQGYTIIRIYQIDVWHDKNDWKNKLLKAIAPVAEPSVIYIASGDQYKSFNDYIPKK